MLTKRNKPENSSLRTKKFRHFRKRRLVVLMGSKCEICEYDNCLLAFVFHHILPDKKEFPLTSTNLDKRSNVILDEVVKTTLLCANCHRELHAGLHPEYEETCRRNIDFRAKNIRSIIRQAEVENKCGYLSIKMAIGLDGLT